MVTAVDLQVKTGNFTQVMAAVKTALDGYNTSMGDAVDVTANFDAKGKLLAATLKKMLDEHKELVVEVGKTKNNRLGILGFNVDDKSATEERKQLKRNNAAKMKAITEAAANEIAAGIAAQKDKQAVNDARIQAIANQVGLEIAEGKKAEAKRLSAEAEVKRASIAAYVKIYAAEEKAKAQAKKDAMEAADKQSRYNAARPLATDFAKGFASSITNNTGLNFTNITEEQRNSIINQRNQVQKLIADGKVARNTLIQIADLVENQQAHKFVPKSEAEIAALTKILELHRLIYKVANNPQTKAAPDPVAQAIQAKAQSERFAALLNNRLVNGNVAFKSYSQKDQDAITRKLLALQGVLANTGISVQRVDEIFRAFVSGNVNGLGTIVGKEKDVYNAIDDLAKVYNKVGEAATKTAEKEKKAADASVTAAKKRTASIIAEVQKQQAEADRNRRASAAPGIGQSFVDNLGGLKDDFTKQGLASVQRANLEIQKVYANGRLTQDRMVQIFDAIRSNAVRSLGTLTTEELKAEVALRRLISAYDGATDAGKRTSEMMIKFNTGLRLLAIQQIHLVISKITNALIQAKTAGTEYEQRLAEIQTITLTANRSTSQWSASLVNLSNSFGTDLLKTTEAAYEAASNQIAKGANVTVFLADAFKLARTTAASAEQSVNILSSAINAYGTSAVEAERYSAILFKLADLGRVRVGELANTFGNTATLAHNVGISIEELSAAMATLTIQGIRPDTSMTLVNNIILKLLKPTKEMTGLFREWGVESGQAAIATFGFGGVLARFDAELQKGGVSRLGELVSDMRAIRGQIGLTGQAFGKYTDALKQIKDAQLDYEKAASLTADTVAHKLNIEMAKLNNYFVADAVQRYNRILLEFYQTSGGLVTNIRGFVDAGLNMFAVGSKIGAVFLNLTRVFGDTNSTLQIALPTALSMFAAYKTAPFIINAATGAQALWNIALGTGSTKSASLAAWNTRLAASFSAVAIAQNAALIGIPLLVGAFAYLVSSAQESSNELANLAAKTEADLNSSMEKTLATLNRSVSSSNKEYEDALGKRYQTFSRYVAAIQAAVNANLGPKLKEILDPNISAYKERSFELSLVGKDDAEKLRIVREHVRDLAGEIAILARTGDTENLEKKFKSMAEAAKDFTNEAQRGLDKVSKELKKFDKETANKALENQLKGLSDPAKANKLGQVIAKLRKEAQDESKKGNLQAAKDKLEEAEKLNQQLINLTDKTSKKGKGSQKGVKEDIEIRAELRKVLLAQQDEYQKKVAEGRKLEDEANKQTINGVNGVIDKMKEYKQAIIDAQEQMKALNAEVQRLGKEKTEKAASISSSRNSLVGAASAYAKQVEGLQGYHAGAEVGNFEENAQYSRIQAMREELQKLITEYKDIQTNDSKNETGLRSKAATIQELFGKLNAATNSYTYSGTNQLTSQGADGVQLGTRAINTLQASTDYSKNVAAADKANTEYDAALQNRAPIEAGLKTAEQAAKDLATRVPGALELFSKTFERETTTFENSAQRLNSATDTIIKSLTDMANGKATPGGKATGGMLGFASGGLLSGPTGRDNRIFRGHAGESVNTKETTSQFYSQIVAMGSGSGARGLMSSGPTINVGDINNNFTGSNTQQSVQDFGRELRRAIRAGTVRLS